MKNQINKSLVNRGCWKRLKNCMNRADRNEKMSIAFLGGSITQGSAASSNKTCYAWKVWNWWKEKFPQTTITYINAGIGGTDSLFGGARAQEEVLLKSPDVVFVDFTVNDEANEFYKETFEGLLRRLYYGSKKTAVVVLNNVYYNSGLSAQEYHNSVASRYGIPCISAREGIYDKIREGIIRTEEITSDFLHPNDFGHSLLAAELIDFLENVWEDRYRQEEEIEDPGALTANAYEHTVRWQTFNSNPLMEGFEEDRRQKNDYYDHFKLGWTGSKKGAKITFEIFCGNLAIQYRKTPRYPAPKARILVDGKDKGILDGNFQETWGDCLFLQPVLHHGERRVHKITIEITEVPETGGVPFYLMSLISS